MLPVAGVDFGHGGLVVRGVEVWEPGSPSGGEFYIGDLSCWEDVEDCLLDFSWSWRG